MCCHETPPDRRQFLTRLTGTAVTLAAASTLAGALEACGDYGTTTQGGSLTVDVSGLTQDGQALVAGNGPDGAPVLVRRQAAGNFVALSMICTHQGCVLDDPTSNGVMFCPCHGSEFNLQGAVLRGPASQPLTQLSAQFDATTDKITITF